MGVRVVGRTVAPTRGTGPGCSYTTVLGKTAVLRNLGVTVVVPGVVHISAFSSNTFCTFLEISTVLRSEVATLANPGKHGKHGKQW